jgi:tetratricopeptide (TPR) repeat protein
MLRNVVHSTGAARGSAGRRPPARRTAGRWAAGALAALLLVFPLAGCRLRRTSDVAPEPSKRRGHADEVGTGYDVALPARICDMSEGDLAIWNDPRFQRRFTESYIAETEIEPPITLDERETMQKVLALHEEGKREEAVRLLQKRRNDAATAVFDYTLGNIYFETDQLEKAALAYTVAVDKHEKFRRAWRNLGQAYLRLSRFEKAIPAFTETIRLGGGDAVVYGLLGYAYSMVEKNLPAESAYRMAILLDPKTLDWKMGLARSFFKQERFAEAVALCESLIKENPKRTDLWLLQANAYIGLEKPLEAAENFELVDRLGGATVESLNMLGDIYINEGIYELAVTYYVRAMEKDPRKSRSRAIRAANVLTSRGAHEPTRRLIARIQEVYGDGLAEEERIDLLRLRARLAVAEGKGEEEIRVLKQIVELDPLDGEALILLGQHYAREGETEQAVFYYERARRLEKYEADACVRHAQLLVKESKYGEALPLLRRAQQIKPRENVEEYLEQVQRIAKARGGGG